MQKAKNILQWLLYIALSHETHTLRISINRNVEAFVTSTRTIERKTQ